MKYIIIGTMASVLGAVEAETEKQALDIYCQCYVDEHRNEILERYKNVWWAKDATEEKILAYEMGERHFGIHAVSEDEYIKCVNDAKVIGNDLLRHVYVPRNTHELRLLHPDFRG